MMWNAIPNDERLRLWKTLREDLSTLPLDRRLEEIARFCSSIPFGSRTLDYYSPADWPTPWEILFYGSFCTSSISLLMFYTFVMVPNDEKIELLLVEDEDGIYLLPLINDQFVLNYELGKVNSKDEVFNEVKIIKTYDRNSIKDIR